MPITSTISIAHGNSDVRNDPLFRFKDLPIELQLQVVQHIVPLPELLQFRLVSTSTNALVMEPLFWKEILFSKQVYSTTGHAKYHHHANVDIVKILGSTSASPSCYGSDTNIVAHQHPRRASVLSMLKQSSDGTIEFERNNQSQLPLANIISSSSIKSRYVFTWSDIEESFVAFISRLSTLERTAHSIEIVTLEDWEGDATMRSIWCRLTQLTGLKDLSIRRSIAKCLHTGVLSQTRVLQHLTRFELKDCVHLYDLPRILHLMPHIHELSLEGCTSLLDFSSLAPRGIYELPYRKLNLANTKVHDSELVEILRRSPHIQELRLDQCYELTATSLEAIGYGSEKPTIEVMGIVNQLQSHASHGLDHEKPRSVLFSSPFCPSLKALSLKDCYDLADESVRALAGCRQLEYLIIRGLRHVNEETVDWLHSQGVPLRKALSPLGRWRYWHH
ncbi:hypothetical protein BGX27_007437 [Mortierella sp. AM989]|nr:hypothetical protein BGX27_007437 [Mortierella sp. AM989]